MAYTFPQTKVLLSGQNASSSASLVFTSLITSNFSTYFLDIRNVISSVINDAIVVTFSTNNGSTYLNSGYAWVINFGDSGAGHGSFGNNSDTSITISNALNITSGSYTSADVYLFNMNSSSFNPTVMGLLDNGIDDNNNMGGGRLYGSNTTTTPVTALKVAFVNGNIVTGSVYLYGIVEP